MTTPPKCSPRARPPRHSLATSHAVPRFVHRHGQENDMAGAPLRNQPRLSVELFRGFLEGRPDEEHWELIDGVAMMMTPPTKAHQRIASNLERLLNDALEGHAPTLTAYQCIGLNL